MSVPVTWSQVVDECDKRIVELTKVCINSQSSEQLIRQAQAGIDECNRLKTLPERLAASIQQRNNVSGRREY